MTTKAGIAVLTVTIAIAIMSAAGSSQCGDCNEDGFTTTVLDALAAANIDVGLSAPSANQTVNCDIDSTLGIDIVDALVIAQHAVGLPVTLNCPQNPMILGAAASFGGFGGSAGITNSGIQTVINGDIGTTAVSTSVTGFHDTGLGCTYTETPLNIGTVNGMIYSAPPPPTVACPTEGTAATLVVATQAREDALTYYNALAALPAGSDPGAGSLANLVLAPGVYTAAAGSFIIQGGDLTLDAQGDPNATWIFQMATSLTVGDPGLSQSIILVNMAQAKNVAWQVGSAATINPAGGGTMVGTIITQQGAAFSTAGNTMVVTLNGRVLSLGAAVTLVDTVINVPAP